MRGKLGWYINKNGQLPTSSNQYDGTETVCDQVDKCNYVLTGIGACEPEHTIWLLGLHNDAQRETSYSIMVEIQDGGTDLSCGTAKSIIIILLSVVGGSLLFCTCVCIVCTFVSREKNNGNLARRPDVQFASPSNLESNAALRKPLLHRAYDLSDENSTTSDRAIQVNNMNKKSSMASKHNNLSNQSKPNSLGSQPRPNSLSNQPRKLIGFIQDEDSQSPQPDRQNSKPQTKYLVETNRSGILTPSNQDSSKDLPSGQPIALPITFDQEEEED